MAKHDWLLVCVLFDSEKKNTARQGKNGKDEEE